MMELPFLPNPVGPPWLPASVAEARKWAYYGVLFVFIIMVIALVMAIVSFIFMPAFAILTIGSLVVSAVILFLVKMTVFDPLDQGRFKDASTFMLIWGILGLLSSLIPGILMIVGFIKLQDVFQTPYQQYQAQPGQVQAPPQQAPQQAPPQQYQPQPPQQQAPPVEEHKQQKVDMVKCKNCGVQYPAFMHHCPNCNTPR